MNPVVIEEVTDPVEIAEAQAQRKRFDRNAAWIQVHGQEIYACHRGKCICIAGEEAFVADTPGEALALARAAHSDNGGCFVQYLSCERYARIYAHRR